MIFLLGKNILYGERSGSCIQYNVACKIENLLQRSGRQIQNQTHTAGDSLKIPDVGNRRSQFNITHTLPANAGLGYLNAATVANNTFVTNLLILTAMALPVLAGSENLLTEKTIAFRLQSTIVDGFRLLYLIIRNVARSSGLCPLANLLGRSKTDFNGVVGNFLSAFIYHFD